MTAESIALALEGRRSKAGWVCKCPAHDDRSPSLSLRDDNGRVLVYCFSGCSQVDVIAALRARGLWPEQPKPERVPMTPAEKRAWAVRRRRAERMASDAEAWRAAMVDELEAAKRGAYEAGRLEDVFTAAPEMERIRGLHGAVLADAYIAARNGQPEQTAALIMAWRRDEQIARRLCSWVVQRIGAEHDANSSVAA